MAAEYQETDLSVVDYQCFELDPAVIDPSRYRSLRIRGPRPASLAKGTYFVCLGAAQTFGRFCSKPFPTLLSEQLRIPTLNISHGGAGPSFYCYDNQRLLDILNGARFVIVQVMSGRSESNSRFSSRGVGHYRRHSDGLEMSSDEAFETLIRSETPETVARIAEESRTSWLASYRTLLGQISVPKVLFWFSTRGPRYEQKLGSVNELFGAYPQLVNETMLQELRASCEALVECTSRRGLPQLLRDRKTGKPITISDPWTSKPWDKNWYYPSPEMHEDAARALEPTCREIVGLPQAARRWWPFRRRTAA